MPGSDDKKNTGNGQNLKAFVRSRAGAVGDRLSGGRISTLEQQLDRARRRLERKDQEIDSLRARLGEASGEDRPPVFFLVGQSKSGTGWLMKMLNEHPEVLCQGEGRFFGGDWSKALQAMEKWRDTDHSAAGGRSPAGSLYGAITDPGPIRYWFERPSFWTKKGDADEHLNRLVGRFVEQFLHERLAKTDKKMVGDKSPLPGPNVVRQISKSIPEAKIIHIVRDGRDQAVSWMHHLWKGAQDQGGRYNLTTLELAKRDEFYRTRRVPLEDGGGIFPEDRLRTVAGFWSTRVGKTVEDGPALFGDRYTEVKYEDLLERPEQEMTRLFGFLGAEADEQTVRQCVRENSFEALSGRERGTEDYGLDFKKHRKGISGDWKNVFTERDKEIYKEVAGELLVKLGYAPDNDW